ncbi:MAG: cobyrinate a,c-diamide synthase, partial [Flavobacteriales bacterium]
GIPVILVVDASAVAHSVAPLLYGFKNYDKNVNLKGAIFNNVNSESHYRFLKEACEDAGVVAMGYFPKNDKINIDSRHLGLSLSELESFKENVSFVAEQLNNTVDIEELLKVTSTEKENIPVQANKPNNSSSDEDKKTVIAVAKDEAFNFIYRENIEHFRKEGIIKYFSPIKDEKLPEDTELVYLAGGYPELSLKELSDNDSMKKSIKEYCESGGKILAECGGMMYLGNSLTSKEGKEYPMVGIFDYKTTMEPMKLKLGYRKAGIGGMELNGHEFHYSKCLNDNQTETVGKVVNARDEPVNAKIYKYKRTIATYLHFYWGEMSFRNWLNIYDHD